MHSTRKGTFKETSKKSTEKSSRKEQAKANSSGRIFRRILKDIIEPEHEPQVLGNEQEGGGNLQIESEVRLQLLISLLYQMLTAMKGDGLEDSHRISIPSEAITQKDKARDLRLIFTNRITVKLSSLLSPTCSTQSPSRVQAVHADSLDFTWTLLGLNLG